MRLRTKFALFLSICVVASVFFNTVTLTRRFTQDLKSYLHDFQSSLALFSQNQLGVPDGAPPFSGGRARSVWR